MIYVSVAERMSRAKREVEKKVGNGGKTKKP
jgi:hypothetical protein